MILYCTIIAVCVCLLTAANMIFAAPVFGFGFWFVLRAVLLSVVAVPHGDQHGDDGHTRAISHPETADL